MTKDRVERFLSESTRWASGQSDIQAVALVGSYARGTANEASDVDLIVVANRPSLYLEDRAWALAFGKIVSQQVEDYGRLVSLRIRYEDQLEVEYGLTDKGWTALPLDEGTREVIAGGMNVLFEREPLLSRHR